VKKILLATVMALAATAANAKEPIAPAIAANVFSYEKQFSQEECLAHASDTLKRLGVTQIQSNEVSSRGYSPTDPILGLYIRCHAIAKSIFFVVSVAENPKHPVDLLPALDRLIKAFDEGK
jgi:hypothetical protein